MQSRWSQLAHSYCVLVQVNEIPIRASDLPQSRLAAWHRERNKEGERPGGLCALELNWIARKILIWHPHTNTLESPQVFALLSSLLSSSSGLPCCTTAPIDLPSHLASLPPAAATRTPIRNGGTPLAVGCRLLSTRDMRSDPRNDRCAPRRRPRIA